MYWPHEILFDPELVLDDVLGSSSMRLSPHLGPLPVGEEESSFRLFQVLCRCRGRCDQETQRQLSLLQISIKDCPTITLPLV